MVYLSGPSLPVYLNQLWSHNRWRVVDIQEPPCDKICSLIIENGLKSFVYSWDSFHP